MQSRTPYVDWTLSISILHSLMHRNTPTFLVKIGECFPQGLGTSTSQLIHTRSMLTLAFITHLTLSTKAWKKQLLLQSLPPLPALNPSPLVWRKSLHGYSPSTITTTGTIAPCAGADADADDVKCNAGNTPWTPMDIVSSTESFKALYRFGCIRLRVNYQFPNDPRFDPEASIAASWGTVAFYEVYPCSRTLMMVVEFNPEMSD
jgi:hypothetical protein